MRGIIKMLLSTTIGCYLEKMSPSDTVDTLAKAGFDALDFGFFKGKFYSPDSDEAAPEFFTELRKYAESRGLVFNQAHAPYPSSRDSAEETENRFGDIVRSMKSASLLGIKTIVVHPCQHLDYLKPGIPEQLFEMNMAFYKRLIPYCEEYGIKVALENMWRYRDGSRKIDHSTLSHPDEFVRYLDELASPCFTACLDIGHAMLVCEDIPTFIRKLGADRLTALHVHDVDGMTDTHTAPFYGICPWDEITAVLSEIGYRGDFTYEATNFIRKLPPELFLTASKHLASTGRYLMGRIEG